MYTWQPQKKHILNDKKANVFTWMMNNKPITHGGEGKDFRVNWRKQTNSPLLTQQILLTEKLNKR